MERPRVQKRCCVCGRAFPLKGDSELQAAGVRILVRDQQTLYICSHHRDADPNAFYPTFTTAAEYKRYPLTPVTEYRRYQT